MAYKTAVHVALALEGKRLEILQLDEWLNRPVIERTLHYQFSHLIYPDDVREQLVNNRGAGAS